MLVRSVLKEIRTARGFSAAELAQRIGVSRQAIYAIENGTFVPNTAVSLQLSRALDVAVEDIFSIPEEEIGERIEADLLHSEQVAQGQPARVGRVDNRLVAIPVSFPLAYLPECDGVIEARTGQRVSVNLFAAPPESGTTLLVAGCDPALSLLSESARSRRMEIIAIPCSSRHALDLLKQKRVHAAGSHLLDLSTGDYNLPIIRRLLPKTSVKVITFAIWEQGIVVRRGNPKGIRAISDLARKDITAMNRERGSGSRNLLDRGLRKLGVPSAQVRGYESVARGHLAAAYAVASGTVDCCIAVRSAARCFGLEFVPLAVERFDLAFRRTAVNSPVAKAVLDLLNGSQLRNKLRSIAGYDTARTGEVLV